MRLITVIKRLKELEKEHGSNISVFVDGCKPIWEKNSIRLDEGEEWPGDFNMPRKFIHICSD